MSITFVSLNQNQLSGYLLRKFKNSNGWQKLWVVFTNFCLFFYKKYQVSYIPVAVCIFCRDDVVSSCLLPSCNVGNGIIFLDWCLLYMSVHSFSVRFLDRYCYHWYLMNSLSSLNETYREYSLTTKIGNFTCKIILAPFIWQIQTTHFQHSSNARSWSAAKMDCFWIFMYLLQCRIIFVLLD